ncbi:MAG TPA: methyltransferase domain-containing protein [Thermoleophilaceae bacterium]|jgi:SAM-dependent methyltransferase
MTTYVLGSHERERERLAHQSSALADVTERFLLAAGLGPGMRVLDLGAGIGDVAAVAARIVGPGGEVVGVERDPAMIEAATGRLAEELPIRLVQGDLTELDLDEPPFDAAIGRFILMHLTDPAAAVSAAARHVRAGGIVTFQESTPSEVRVHPPLPKTEALIDLLMRVSHRMGPDLRAGDNLRATFLAAGLPDPELRLEALIGGRPDAPVYDMLAGITETLLPEIERRGLARPGEIDPWRLASELRREVGRAGGVLVAPPLVAAWARVPD